MTIRYYNNDSYHKSEFWFSERYRIYKLKFLEECSSSCYLLPPSSKTVPVRVKQVKVSTHLTSVALISPALRGCLLGPGAGHPSVNGWPWDQNGIMLLGRSISVNLKLVTPMINKRLPYWNPQCILHEVVKPSTVIELRIRIYFLLHLLS